MNETLAKEDAAGLICAYLLDGRGRARPLNWTEVMEGGHEGVLWVHLDFSNPQARDWLVSNSGIDPAVADAMLVEEIRPRSVQFEEGILAILRGVNTNPGSEAEDMVSIRLWLERNRIISTRRRRLLSVHDMTTRFDTGDGPVDVGNFIVELAGRMVERIGEVVNEIEEDLETTETAMQEGRAASMRGRFAEIRRRSARIRRYLAPQREALDRLSRMQGGILSERDCVALYEEANEVTHYVEDLDLARERAMVAQEEVLSILAHEQNSKMYLLSIVAAVFLPLSFLTGLMGMNVAGLPGTENPTAFLILSAIMVAVALGILLVFRIKRWL
jgi:zinc transporter